MGYEAKVDRRGFLRALGIGGAAAATLGAGVPDALAALWGADADGPGRWRPGHGPWRAADGAPRPERPILLHNNENPEGPPESALQAMGAILGDGPPAGRYPFADARELTRIIADVHGVSPDRVMIGNGSTQLLRTATQVFTSPTRPLAAGSLTYEECGGYAGVVGHAVESVPLRDDLHLDLDGMAEAARGAGMVFLCNPNNPSAIVHSADAVGAFVDRVRSAAPDTVILVDEAYHDYVTDPAYESQIPRAARGDGIVVARTFSKAHGMAGLRMGYVVGDPALLERMAGWHYGNSLNVLAIAAAAASIVDDARLARESDRNTAARDYTIDWFARHGIACTDSQTNFVFAEIDRSARQFREACLEKGIRVGRDFPPLENRYARISVGSMEEMQYATEVFGNVLGVREAAEAAA